MAYLGWFDDNPKKPSAAKIAEACAAYRARFGIAPTVILCNELDLAVVDGVRIEARPYVRRFNFWAGMVG